MKKQLQEAIKKLGRLAAASAGSSASSFFCYQAKEPENLKELLQEEKSKEK